MNTVFWSLRGGRGTHCNRSQRLHCTTHSDLSHAVVHSERGGRPASRERGSTHTKLERYLRRGKGVSLVPQGGRVLGSQSGEGSDHGVPVREVVGAESLSLWNMELLVLQDSVGVRAALPIQVYVPAYHIRQRLH